MRTTFPDLAAGASATRRIIAELITAKQLVRATRRTTDPHEEASPRWTKNALALPDEAPRGAVFVLEEERRVGERHERYRRRALARSSRQSVGERVNTPSALTVADIEPDA